MFDGTPENNASALENEEKPFRIVTIYDSAASSVEAALASAVVLRELGDEVAVDKSSWSVQSLAATGTCGAAAQDAARADLIVVAFSASAPEAVLKNWVAAWEGKRQVAGGLLAFIPSGEKLDCASAEQLFYETAVSANMDFLCRKQPRF